MYQMDKNIAEKHVVTLEATMWKLHVNAITWHARSRFRNSRLEVRGTWLAETVVCIGAHYIAGNNPREIANATHRRRIDCEVH
jgi:hypothetical protein